MSISLLLKSLIGFVLVFVIQLFAKSKNYYISALIPLFPSIGMFSYYFVFEDKGIEGLRPTIIFGIFSLLPYFAFLLSLYFFTAKFKIVPSLFMSSAVWFAVAFVLIFMWNIYHK